MNLCELMTTSYIVCTSLLMMGIVVNGILSIMIVKMLLKMRARCTK